jgi:hypothetical protein
VPDPTLWFWKGVNPRAAVAAITGAMFPLADFVAAAWPGYTFIATPSEAI